MTLLAELVETSRRVAETPSRNAKTAELAACLRKLAPAEIETGVAYLSGETRQGRSGIGYALLRDARPAARAAEPSLTIGDVDSALARIASITGAGSKGERIRILSELFARATDEERDFLVRLLLGELRQGALESLMIDAVAAAASLPPSSGTASRHGRARDRPGRPCRADGRRQRPSPIRSRADAAHCADARATGGRCRRVRCRRSARQRSNGSSTARACRCTRPATTCAIFTRSRNDVTASAPEIVAAVRASPVRGAHPRRRGDRAQGQRRAAAVPDHDAPLRAHAGRAGDAGVAAVVGVLLRLHALRRRTR